MRLNRNNAEGTTPTRSLHRFALLTALATLGLLGVGGLVTSHGAGMAVPDWPNTYGYNMFFFPLSQWVGGIFYEHTHRLLASGVGLLTVILTLWLYGRRARPVMRWGGLALLALGATATAAAANRWQNGAVAGVAGLFAFGASWFWPGCEPSAKWLRRCGLAALAAVILQGVLGGLRVVLLKDAIGIFHATLAQLFFVLICAIALFTSRWWQVGTPRRGVREEREDGRLGEPSLPRLSTLFTLTTLLILGQLALGAAMRHQHAGLAIPDFPLAYGKLWPAMDAASVVRYNQERLEVFAYNPITATQVALQMVHRLMALAIFAAIAFAAWFTRRTLGGGNRLSRLALGWLGLVFVQGLLGAATIWSNKAADVATAHVLVGALTLALGGMMSLIAFRDEGFGERTAGAPSSVTPPDLAMLEPQPSGAAGLH